MKTFNFIMRVAGSAKGTVIANSKKEALKIIEEGQWNDIDIDVEDIIEVEHLTEKQNKKSFHMEEGIENEYSKNRI